MLTFDTTKFGALEFVSLAYITQRLSQLHADYRDIMCTGFNTSSGYVYIALECGITIASCFGQPPRYIVNDYDTDEELIFPSFGAAAHHLKMHA